LEGLQRRREHVVESYAGILPDVLDALSGEERRLYGMLRLEVAPTQGGLEIAGALSASGIQTLTSSLVRSRSAVRVCSSALFFTCKFPRNPTVLGANTKDLAAVGQQ